jgi:hypothetical protein
MTAPEGSTDIAALALALFGEFSKLQELIDGLANLYVRKRAPGLNDFLSEQGALSPDLGQPAVTPRPTHRRRPGHRQ